MPSPRDLLNGGCFINAQLQLHLRGGEGPSLNSTFSAPKGCAFKKERREGRGEARGPEAGREGKAALLIQKQKEQSQAVITSDLIY